ncbi:MAG: tetratricopeptide repeat protein, partial [Polyangia bacterium]
MPVLPLIMTLAIFMGDPEASFRAARELGHLGEASAAEDVSAARRALEARDFERAAALAALGLARAPDATDAAMVLGLARFRAHQPAAAIAPFSRAVALAPTSATLRFDLAAALYQAGRFVEAENRYLEAAERDEKIAPLSLYDAGLAALDGGRPDRAIVHLQAAEKAARAAGQTPVANEARQTLQSLAHRSRAGATPELLRLTHAGTEALAARRYAEAADHYRRALDLAVAEGASSDDRAELQYDLGDALYRANDLVAAARALAAAVELRPREAEFHYLLGLVHFDAGADRDAKLALERAMALGLAGAQARRAGAILRARAETRRGETSRFYLEVRSALGLDTNVPQSGIVVTAANGGGENTDAPFLESDLDFFWRPAGTARNGFSAEYRFAQLAYLSDALDLYSLQEHDLTLSGAWTPTARLTLELGGDGYLLFSGVETFAPFQTGASIGPRITVREPHGFETRLRAQHIFKRSLDATYDYL